MQLEGDVVEGLYDMALLSWAERMEPVLPLVVNPPAKAGNTNVAGQAQSVGAQSVAQGQTQTANVDADVARAQAQGVNVPGQPPVLSQTPLHTQGQSQSQNADVGAQMEGLHLGETQGQSANPDVTGQGQGQGQAQGQGGPRGEGRGRGGEDCFEEARRRKGASLSTHSE